MPIINLTEEELTKLWEAVNDGAELAAMEARHDKTRALE
jgi:hypothetical protein